MEKPNRAYDAQLKKLLEDGDAAYEAEIRRQKVERKKIDKESNNDDKAQVVPKDEPVATKQ